MCLLYVSFGSNVRPRTFGCVAMRSAVVFIFRSRLLLYSAGSGVNRVQVVLSGFSVRLFCFVKNCMYVWLYVFLCCTIHLRKLKRGEMWSSHLVRTMSNINFNQILYD